MKKLSKILTLLLLVPVISLNFLSCTAEDITSEEAADDAQPKTSRSRPLTGFYDDAEGSTGTTDGTQEKRRSKVLEDIQKSGG